MRFIAHAILAGHPSEHRRLGDISEAASLLVEAAARMESRTDLPGCCAQRDELWRDVTGWDLLGQVTRRLDSMTAQLNAARRHEEGRRWEDSKLPQIAEIPLAYGVVLPIPLDVQGTPVSYQEAMANLMNALATALTVAVGNGRWAVNEHQRAERLERTLTELDAAVGDFFEFRNDVPPFDERLTQALIAAQEVLRG